MENFAVTLGNDPLDYDIQWFIGKILQIDLQNGIVR